MEKKQHTRRIAGQTWTRISGGKARQGALEQICSVVAGKPGEARPPVYQSKDGLTQIRACRVSLSVLDWEVWHLERGEWIEGEVHNRLRDAARSAGRRG